MQNTITFMPSPKLDERVRKVTMDALAARGGLPSYAVTDGQDVPAGTHVIYDMGRHRLHSVPYSDLERLLELREDAFAILEAGGEAVRLLVSSMQLPRSDLLVPMPAVEEVAAMFAGHVQHVHLVSPAATSLVDRLQEIGRRAYAARSAGAPLVRITLSCPQLGHDTLLCAVPDAGELTSLIGDCIAGAEMDQAAPLREVLKQCSIGDGDVHSQAA